MRWERAGPNPLLPLPLWRFVRPLWIGVAVLFVAVAVTALLSLEAPEPPVSAEAAEVWHVASSTSVSERFCGDCHYGLTEMWNAAWMQSDRNWTLTVEPAYTEAPLLAVQVASAEEDLLLAGGDWDSFDWRVGETRRSSFLVPEGATSVFVRLHGTGPDDANFVAATNLLGSRPNDAVTQLVLVAPDGSRIEAPGPQSDLKVLIVPAQAGSWTVEATLVSGDSPVGVGWVLWEALGGDVVPEVLTRSAAPSWTFEGNASGAPPSVWLRVRPHHDHAPYEHTDWDAFDVSPFVTRFEAAPGPEPLVRAWNATAIDALWAGQTERVVLERSGSFRGVYLDEEGHNDPGIGSSYPAFGSMGDPVWPGTALMRFEVSWSPAVDVPGMGVRFSPAHTTYFFDATLVSSAPGSAVFEALVQPEWWEEPDQVLAWLDPEHVTSYWDIATRISGEGAEAHAVDWELRVVTLRA